MKKVYVAIPYSGMEEESFRQANNYTADLMGKGYVVYSPISHSHSIAMDNDMPTNWEFWKEQDLPFIEFSDELHVLMVGENGRERVRNSVGVQAEIEEAKKLRKNIKYIILDA